MLPSQIKPVSLVSFRLIDSSKFPLHSLLTQTSSLFPPNVALNAHHFLKNNGYIVISIKASCIDSTVDAATVFAREVKKLQEERVKPQEQLTLEPYERDHALVVGKYVRAK